MNDGDFFLMSEAPAIILRFLHTVTLNDYGRYRNTYIYFDYDFDFAFIAVTH